MYEKTNWVDHIVAPDGTVVQQGTPITAKKLNKIESGVEGAATQLALENEAIQRINAYNQLQIIKANKTEVYELVASVSDGTPEALADLNAIQSTYPTGNSHVKLNLEDGYVYKWSGSEWVQGWVYQETVISPGAISLLNLDATLQEQVTETWVEDSVLYAITDNNGHAALSVDAEGKLKIEQPVFNPRTIDETSLIGVENRDIGLTGVLWGIIDSEDRISDLTIGLDGKLLPSIVADLKTRMGLDNAVTIDQLNNIGKSISCWGDSLTGGAAGVPFNKLWPSLIGGMTGRTIHNMGVGGESSATISSRQGGSNMLVKDFTIPADSTAVLVADQSNKPIIDNWGTIVTPLKQQWAGVNPVTINGIKGTLSIIDPSLSTSKWYFTRLTPGVEVIVDRPTAVLTDAMISHRENIMIIFMGQNGGWGNDNNVLIQQIRRMIEFNSSAKKEYLVLGLTSGTASSRASLEYAMSHEFGRRYVNLRDYLSTYGIYDAGISPTLADLNAMSIGSVPASLLGDAVHFNELGHQVIANIVNLRLVELDIV